MELKRLSRFPCFFIPCSGPGYWKVRVRQNWKITCVPVLLVIGQCCHALDLSNIQELGDTDTIKIFQYRSILEHSNIWDLKAFFCGIRLTYYIILAPKFSYPANLTYFSTTLITCVFHTLALQQYQAVCQSKSIFRSSFAIQKYMDYWKKVNKWNQVSLWLPCDDVSAVIVPSDLAQSFGATCAHYRYRVIHPAITYMRAWFKSTGEKQLTLN